MLLGHGHCLANKSTMAVTLWIHPGILNSTTGLNTAELRYQLLQVSNKAPSAVAWTGGPGRGGGGWHKALVVGSVSLWRRLLASRL